MQRFLIALISFTFSVSSVHAYDEDGNYAVWGLGQKSCFAYTKARESNDYKNYSNYIKGFLTAYNMIEKETYSITSGMSFSEILEWIDDECELKQINPLEQALLGLIDAKYDNRLKKAKKRGGR